jgi:hypothetical protein
MRPIRLVAGTLVSLFAATAAPALLFAVLTRSTAAFVIAFVIALPHALVLGLPLFLLLRAKRYVNAVSSIAGGFVVGVFPCAVLAARGYAGWDASFFAVAMLGGFGAIGGLAFFALWKIFGEAFERPDAPQGA